MTILFERAREIFTQNLRAYWVFSAIYYALMILLMICANLNPTLYQMFADTFGRRFLTGALTLIGEPFGFGQALKAVMDGFVYNIMGLSYAEISLPSFVIPFSGVLIGLFRAVILGIAFSPANVTPSGIFLPHLPTLFLEGQSAVLAILGSYIHGRALLWPKTVGQTSRWRAYIEGVRQIGILYFPMAAVLLISALYGILEVAFVSAR